MANRFRIDELTKYYHYRFAPDYAFVGHTHIEWELNIILGGEMRITIDDRVFTGKRGDMFVIRPWIFHSNRVAADGTEMMVVHFRASEEYPDFTARTLSDCELGAAELAVQEFDKFGFTEELPYCDDMSSDLENPRKLLEVLLALDSESEIIGEASRRAGLYSEAVELMRASLCEKLTINDISKSLHVSPTVLKSVFTRIAGKGIIEYFTEMKISEARRLIGEGKSLSYVSDYLGFSSQCYFSTVYKRVLGVSPKEGKK